MLTKRSEAINLGFIAVAIHLSSFPDVVLGLYLMKNEKFIELYQLYREQTLVAVIKVGKPRTKMVGTFC